MRDPQRKTGGRFALVPLSVLKDPAVTTLDASVRWVLIALTGQYSGGNNGRLSLTRAVAREYGIRSVDTLRRGLLKLCERGLIEQTHPGSYVPPTPACYALTWQPLDQTEWTRKTRTPSHAYRTTGPWTRATAAPARPYRGTQRSGRIPRKTINAVRPPDPLGPFTGPFVLIEGAETRRLGPPTGPIFRTAGSAHRTPLDIYHSVPAREAA